MLRAHCRHSVHKPSKVSLVLQALIVLMKRPYVFLLIASGIFHLFTASTVLLRTHVPLSSSPATELLSCQLFRTQSLEGLHIFSGHLEHPIGYCT